MLAASPASAATVVIEAESCVRGGSWELENWGGYSGAYAARIASSVESELACTVMVPDGSEGTLAVWFYRDVSANSHARYRLDGGEWVTFTTAGAPGFASYSIPVTLEAGAHALTFSNSADPATLALDNIVLTTSPVATTTTSSTSSTSSTTTSSTTTTTTFDPGSPGPSTSDPEDESRLFVLGMLGSLTAGAVVASVLVPKP